jgi:HPt (histidine-containing phosphotransfer) domain-containing protein
MKTPKKGRAKDAIAIVTYGDHEVITPENRLSGAVSTKTPGEPHDDPVARAEKALAELSSEFGSWMDSECDRLDKARRAFAKDVGRSNADALFHAAHDIKGEAATFGYPAIASAAKSLCRLIEYTPDAARIPLSTRRCGACDLSRICAFRRPRACGDVDQTPARSHGRVSPARKSRAFRSSRAA